MQPKKSANRPRNRGFPIGEILLAILIGTGFTLFVLLLLNVSRPLPTPVGLVTVALTVIPAPTETPIPPSATPLAPTPTQNIPPAPEAGMLAVGNYVQVSGTGGDGLHIRQGPGLDYEPLFVGLESEIFEVIDGPQEADDYTWWHLAAPYDETLHGWAVSNYLEVVENP